MIDFDIDMNPEDIDMSMYNADLTAMENLKLSPNIPGASGGNDGAGGAYVVKETIEVGQITELKIPGTGYESSSCKIYYPEGIGPFPVLFYVHGGGYFSGWQFLDEPLCRQVCRECGIAVVSPKYVLAPQFTYPRPLIELYRDLLYLREHAEELHLDMSKLAIGGASAGGHHALSLCQLVYDRKEIDHLEFQYGIFAYPVLDTVTPSDKKTDALTDRKAMPPETLDIAIDSYFDKDTDRTDPCASPIRMDLEALPPFFMFSGRTDALNGEFRKFAARVMEEGKNEAIFKIYPDTAHGFLESNVGPEAAEDSKALMCDLLRRALR